MKTATKILAALGIAALLASCTLQVAGPRTKGKVRTIITARSAAHNVSKGLAPGRHLLSSLPKQPKTLSKSRLRAPLAASRNLGQAKPRDLSAYYDINSIDFQIVNLDPNSGESPIVDVVDPNYPYIDIFLSPGQSYTVTVDVTLSDSLAASLAPVGIGKFGDSASFTVPDNGEDAYVDLFVHPVGLAFYNQAITGTSIRYWNPAAPSTYQTGSVSSVTALPGDKFFYTAQGLLYYFNRTASALYEWTNVGAPLSTATPLFDLAAISTDIPTITQLYAVCPEQDYPGWFFALALDGSSIGLIEIDATAGPGSVYSYPYVDLGPDLDSYNPGGGKAVTGLAADSYGDVFVSFYNAVPSTGPVVSGVLEYNFGYLYAAYVPDTSGGWSSSDSVFTDLMYSGGLLYALASPIGPTAIGGITNRGTADIYTFDYYMDQLSSNPSPVAQQYSGSLALGAGSLTMPNRFAGLVQNGELLISQADFVAPGAEKLSAVSTDFRMVTALP